MPAERVSMRQIREVLRLRFASELPQRAIAKSLGLSNSTFTYKGLAVDVKQVGRELGVRYVLEGSVRKAGGRVRITAELIDAVIGTHLWADRFDGLLEDIFELQDRVAVSVAGVIEPTLQAAEIRRSAGRSTADLTAYDLYLRAYAMVWSSARQIPEALRLTQQAIDRDPRYGPALALAAFCCVRLLRDGRSEDRSADGLKGADFAQRALEVAGDDADILANAALALAYLGEDIGAMMALVDRALARAHGRDRRALGSAGRHWELVRPTVDELRRRLQTSVHGSVYATRDHRGCAPRSMRQSSRPELAHSVSRAEAEPHCMHRREPGPRPLTAGGPRLAGEKLACLSNVKVKDHSGE
jgi:tetratricopeptide (TPR) repeat protein